MARPRPFFLPALRALLLLWAGFWIYFGVAVAVDEGPFSLPYAGGFVGIIIALCLTVWFRPRLGGRLLMVAAACAVLFFRNGFTALTLALPAFLLGFAFFQTGFHELTEAAERGSPD